MSTFSVSVVPFNLTKHPNADTLSIATIKGWQCIVRTEEFVNENLGVYVPLDAVTDKDHPLLSFMEGKKVKTIRLRQVISQGVLLPFTKVQKYIKDTHKEVFPEPGQGDDLKDLLFIRKWEPPPEANRGTSVPDFMAIDLPGEMQKYTDIENIKNFPDVLQEGEEVFITEKLHGTSARYGLIDGKFYIGSRNRGLRTENFESKAGELIEIKKSTWHEVAEREYIVELLQKLQQTLNVKSVILYGEIVGKTIQDLRYGHEVPTFYAYDITTVDADGNVGYLPAKSFRETLEAAGAKLVPLLKVGAFSLADLELRNGKTTLNDSHVREGVVIEPAEPRFDYSLGRVILKSIGEEYLLRKGGTDN
jgi:RNA ligase (TIGR02306 family)